MRDVFLWGSWTTPQEWTFISGEGAGPVYLLDVRGVQGGGRGNWSFCGRSRGEWWEGGVMGGGSLDLVGLKGVEGTSAALGWRVGGGGCRVSKRCVC